jgi:hypothetical protein
MLTNGFTMLSKVVSFSNRAYGFDTIKKGFGRLPYRTQFSLANRGIFPKIRCYRMSRRGKALFIPYEAGISSRLWVQTSL